MIWSILAIWFALGLIALAWNWTAHYYDDHYDQQIVRRFERDEALRRMHAAFERQHGRPPTPQELWDICPPTE